MQINLPLWQSTMMQNTYSILCTSMLQYACLLVCFLLAGIGTYGTCTEHLLLEAVGNWTAVGGEPQGLKYRHMCSALVYLEQSPKV